MVCTIYGENQMTTEREMLEYAAKACGIEGNWEREAYVVQERYIFVIPYSNQGMMTGIEWSPIKSSADCAAMCAKLKISTNWASASIYCWDNGSHNERFFIDHNNDREAAWRYAATMVAAKIGGYEEWTK